MSGSSESLKISDCISHDSSMVGTASDEDGAAYEKCWDDSVVDEEPSCVVMTMGDDEVAALEAEENSILMKTLNIEEMEEAEGKNDRIDEEDVPFITAGNLSRITHSPDEEEEVVDESDEEEFLKTHEDTGHDETPFLGNEEEILALEVAAQVASIVRRKTPKQAVQFLSLYCAAGLSRSDAAKLINRPVKKGEWARAKKYALYPGAGEPVKKETSHHFS